MRSGLSIQMDDPWGARHAGIDAASALLYGLSRDVLDYILETIAIFGLDFPSEAVPVLKQREIRRHGGYRTARPVLAASDRLTQDSTFAGWGRV